MTAPFFSPENEQMCGAGLHRGQTRRRGGKVAPAAEGPDCLDEPYQARPRAVIWAELRALVAEHCSPETAAWLRELRPRVWAEPRQMEQLELFTEVA